MYSNTSSPEWMRDVLQLETLACLVTDFPFAKLFYDPIRDPSLQLSAGMESISTLLSCFQSPCEHNPCENEGTCFAVNHWRDFRCECLPSTRGRTCSEGRHSVIYTKFSFIVHARYKSLLIFFYRTSQLKCLQLA